MVKNTLAIAAFVAALSVSQANAETRISLNDYIQGLKSEFIKISASAGDGISINISPVEVELSASFTIDGEGKLQFYVFQVGAGVENVNTQKLKFTVSSGENGGVFQAALPSIGNPWAPVIANLPLSVQAASAEIGSVLASKAAGREGQWSYVLPDTPVFSSSGLKPSEAGGFIFNPAGNNDPNKIEYLSREEILNIIQ